MSRALIVPLTLAALLGPAASTLSHPGHGFLAVSIKGFAYNPREIQAVQSDTVVWFWDGADRNHSVTADPNQSEQFDSDPNGPPGQDTHQASQGFQHQFTQVGTFTYHCKVHAGMKGQVVVGPLSGGPPPPDETAPSISRVVAKPATFCTKRSRRCSKRGTVLVFALTEKADVLVEVFRRKGSKAVGKAVDALDRDGKVGENRLALPGSALKPGRYRVSVIATDEQGNSSKPARVNVTVRR